MIPRIAAVASGIKTLPLNLVWRWPRRGVGAAWHGVKYGVMGCVHGIRWSWREAGYWRTLFFSLSKQFLSGEGVVALVLSFYMFGTLFIQPRPVGGKELLDISYMLVTMLMILFGMNLLPRERDNRTLEMLWSQPISRAGLALLQLLTLTIWMGIMQGVVFLFYSRFAVVQMDVAIVMMMSLSTGLCAGLLTVLMSTFCRHGIATGIVSALIIGAHYGWIQHIGPIALFENPIPPLQGMRAELPIGGIIFNRIFVVILMIFLFDYLVRRLRRTARWFT